MESCNLHDSGEKSFVTESVTFRVYVLALPLFRRFDFCLCLGIDRAEIWLLMRFTGKPFFLPPNSLTLRALRALCHKREGETRFSLGLSFTREGKPFCVLSMNSTPSRRRASRTVSTVNPCAQIRAEYNRILSALHREAKRDRCRGDICTGWDWPTLAIVKPLEYNRLRELSEAHKREFVALRAAGLLAVS